MGGGEAGATKTDTAATRHLDRARDTTEQVVAALK
jgi:hypothetical protein